MRNAVPVLQKRVAPSSAGATGVKRPAHAPGSIRAPRMMNRVRKDGKIEAGEMDIPSIDTVYVPGCRERMITCMPSCPVQTPRLEATV